MKIKQAHELLFGGQTSQLGAVLAGVAAEVLPGFPNTKASIAKSVGELAGRSASLTATRHLATKYEIEAKTWGATLVGSRQLYTAYPDVLREAETWQPYTNRVIQRTSLVIEVADDVAPVVRAGHKVEFYTMRKLMARVSLDHPGPVRRDIAGAARLGARERRDFGALVDRIPTSLGSQTMLPYADAFCQGVNMLAPTFSLAG